MGCTGLQVTYSLDTGQTTYSLDTGQATYPLDTGQITYPMDTGLATYPLDICQATYPLDTTGQATYLLYPLDTGQVTYPLDTGQATIPWTPVKPHIPWTLTTTHGMQHKETLQTVTELSGPSDRVADLVVITRSVLHVTNCPVNKRRSSSLSHVNVTA